MWAACRRDDVVEALAALLELVGPDVPVNAERHGRVGVAELDLHALDRPAGADHETCGAVAEVMPADVVEPTRGACWRPGAVVNPGGADRLAGAVKDPFSARVLADVL